MIKTTSGQVLGYRAAGSSRIEVSWRTKSIHGCVAHYSTVSIFPESSYMCRKGCRLGLSCKPSSKMVKMRKEEKVPRLLILQLGLARALPNETRLEGSRQLGE